MICLAVIFSQDLICLFVSRSSVYHSFVCQSLLIRISHLPVSLSLVCLKSVSLSFICLSQICLFFKDTDEWDTDRQIRERRIGVTDRHRPLFWGGGGLFSIYLPSGLPEPAVPEVILYPRGAGRLQLMLKLKYIFIKDDLLAISLSDWFIVFSCCTAMIMSILALLAFCF
jgi:hypothetical protein